MEEKNQNQPQETQETKRPKKGIKRTIALVVVVIAFILAGVYLYNEMQYESTDDAYVETTTVNVSPKISGQIEEVFVKDNQFVHEGDLVAIGGGLGLPLFTGGRRIANLKLKKDEYERVLNNYYKTNLTAIQEVNDAMVSLKLDNDKYDDIKTRAKLEREDFGYSTNKYNEGTISKLDLVQVRENVLYTDQQVVNDKINCLVDYIGLYKAVGSQL